MRKIKINYLSFIFCIFYLLILSSCKKGEDVKPSANTLDEISDLATFHGNLQSDIVVVNTQGGPVTELNDEVIKEIISKTKTQSALFVNVHQEQTKNPALFRDTDITFEQAKEYDKQSVATLKQVLDFFNNQEGKTVYVLGISFGAFMTQELLATYGIDVADGYMIMVGRLDIDEETWRSFSQGEYRAYTYDNTGAYTIVPPGLGEEDQPPVEDKNMARLAAGLGHHRYTSRLSNISDLSKVTYVYGDRDERVGPLSAQERQFLNDRNAKVVLEEGGDHDGAIGKGLSLLKRTFAIQ